MQKDKGLKDNIKSATVYPIAVISFSIIILLAMLIFLVPIFQGFFPEGLEVPFVTKIVIMSSDSLRNYWYIWIGIIFSLIMFGNFYAKSESGSINIEKILLKLPAFGPLYQKTIIARFSRTFSTLFSNGIPVVRALESSGEATGSKQMNLAIKNSVLEIQEGGNIGETFAKKKIFPPMVSQMITIGEETGSLPHLLDRIAEFYEDEVLTLSKTITSMIEPILLIFVGIVVGGMLIALYLPIFTAITQSVV